MFQLKSSRELTKNRELELIYRESLQNGRNVKNLVCGEHL